MVLKKTDGLANDPGVDLIAQIRDGGQAGILDLCGAEIFRQSFGKKENDERYGKHGRAVVDARRKVIVEIEDLATPGNREERQTGTGHPWMKNEVHGQLDHQRNAAFG